MLDEDCDNEENTGDGNEPQLLLQRMLVVMLMFMMMFVRTTFAMIVLMCHFICIYSFLVAKLGNSCCNSVAKCLVLGETKGEDTDADALDGG